MAQDTSLNGLRGQIITSIFGRRIGLAQGNSSDSNVEYLTGFRDIRVQSEGWSSAGSTIVSTSVASLLSPYGASILGASGASATTGYTLANPVPGVYKTLIVGTTGYAVVSAGSAFFISTGSAASTHATLTMSGKGCNMILYGLTTGFWAPLNMQFSSVSTNISFS